MAAQERLKNEFTEDEKCHNLMRWLIWRHIYRVLKVSTGYFQRIPRLISSTEKAFVNTVSCHLVGYFSYTIFIHTMCFGPAALSEYCLKEISYYLCTCLPARLTGYNLGSPQHYPLKKQTKKQQRSQC